LTVFLTLVFTLKSVIYTDKLPFSQQKLYTELTHSNVNLII